MSTRRDRLLRKYSTEGKILGTYDAKRFWQNIGLGAFVVLSLGGFRMLYKDPVYLGTIASGYISLILVALTLAIGPVNLLLKKFWRNPVNLYFRRDAGIWSGVMGIVHVVLASQVRLNRIFIEYFFHTINGRYVINLSRFGTANWIGLGATLILVALLITSNDYFLRKLGGPAWKALQRWNYALAILAVIHTLLFQEISRREQPFTDGPVALVVVVLIVQVVGVWVYLRRKS